MSLQVQLLALLGQPRLQDISSDYSQVTMTLAKAMEPEALMVDMKDAPEDITQAAIALHKG